MRRTALTLPKEEDFEAILSFRFSLFSLCLESFVDLLADLPGIGLLILSNPTLLGGFVDGRSGNLSQRVHIYVERTTHLDVWWQGCGVGRPRLWWARCETEDEGDGMGRVGERETEMGRGREAIRERASGFI